MKILKYIDGKDMYLMIAGEILNLELGAECFVNGELICQPSECLEGYPRVQHGNITDVICATVGYIMINVFEVSMQIFETNLIKAINILTALVKIPCKYSSAHEYSTRSTMLINANQTKTLTSDMVGPK